MLYTKKDFPPIGSLVLCTVKSVKYNSVFVNIDEYDNKEGLIHISEISPGRIRNIRDFVKVGKQIVCKTLKVNKERGHIDLSLRRVNGNQKRQKLNFIKQELKAEKIIKDACEMIKADFEKTYYKILEKALSEDWEGIYGPFEARVEEGYELSNIIKTKKLLEAITKIVDERIKRKEIEIKLNLALTTYHENGLELIKKELIEIENIDKEKIKVTYIGAGVYQILVTDREYQSAEKNIKTIEKILEKESKNIEYKLTRIENKTK